MLPILPNEDLKTCGSCGGECCKRMPGEYHPADIDLKNLAEFIMSPNVAVDYWKGDTSPEGDLRQVYYIRPSIINISRKIDPSWGGTCYNLTSSGCRLTFEDRPHGCKMLVPNPKSPGNCNSSWDKRSAAEAWRPYQDLIERAILLLDSD